MFAGICKGKRVTGSTGIKDDMENAGAIWADKPAFRDGNQVWGRVVADTCMVVAPIERMGFRTVAVTSGKAASFSNAGATSCLSLDC